MNSKSIATKAEALLNLLNQSQNIEYVGKTRQYNDNPKPYQFICYINNLRGVGEVSITSTGVSFVSSEIAFLKCVVEAWERVSLFSSKSSKKSWAKYNHSRTQIDLGEYGIKNKLKSHRFSWVKGVDIESKKKISIPSQLVFLDYKARKEEANLNSPAISTGAAADYDIKKALLSGIYEIVERDAFMGVYLNRLSSRRVRVESYKNSEIQKIIRSVARYNLEIIVLDITNDLEIPTFLSLVIDRTGVGHPVSLGLGSSLNIESALIHSMTEPFVAMNWARAIVENSNIKTVGVGDSIKNRAMFWSDIAKLKDLDFLISSRTYYPKYKMGNKKNEYAEVIRKLCDKGFNLYYVDITPKIIAKTGLKVVKVVIPGLQPLYLHESDKECINLKRLEKISEYFDKKMTTTNNIPHPFL